jgi:hypothetical protein
MESNVGALTPGAKWDTQSTKAYFDAFEQATGASTGQFNANPLGKNASGLWGKAAADSGKADAQAAAWSSEYPGQAPNIEQALGAKPTKNFAQKYGATIANLAIGIVAPELLPLAYAAEAGLNHQPIGKALLGGIASMVGGPIVGGAVTGGLNGGWKGALIGGATGAAGALIGQGLSQGLGSNGLGLDPSSAGAITKIGTGYGTSLVRQDLSKMMYNNGGGSSPTSGWGGGDMQTGGNAAQANNMLSQMTGSIGNLFSPVAGMIGAQQGNKQINQGNAAAMLGVQSGQQYGFSGMGGMGGSWNNGQLNLNPGQWGGAAGQFSQFANGQGQMANQYGNGYVPQNVTNGFNQFNTQIGQGIGNANAGANSAMGVMGLGQSTLNSAGANQQNAYNTSLNSALAALNPQIQQQSNALLNSEFQRGMAGSSGGALQTQALQNSFNTANLQAQNQAVGQGLNAYNSTINAGMGMFNSGAGQLGNFNNQGVNFGQAGMQGAMNYNMFSPQMAGMYQQNANMGVTGGSGINNMMLGNFQAGQGAAGLQGKLAIGGAGAYADLNRQFQQSGNGFMGQMGSMVGTPGFGSSLFNGAANLFKGMTGLFNGGGGNPDGFSIPSFDPNSGFSGGSGNFDYGTDPRVPGMNSDGTSMFDTGSGS